MLTRFLLLACLILPLTINAQVEDEMFVEKEFVIILSSKDYNAAFQTAKTAAEKLQYKLDLRDLKKNKETGLTWNEKTCEDEWGEFPCYVARGRYDDGNYVSIEYSNAYNGFTKGYYIVVIAGGTKGSEELKSALTKAKSFYKNAYSKTTKVYTGCMH
jgi:hypothetical protein